MVAVVAVVVAVVGCDWEVNGASRNQHPGQMLEPSRSYYRMLLSSLSVSQWRDVFPDLFFSRSIVVSIFRLFLLPSRTHFIPIGGPRPRGCLNSQPVIPSFINVSCLAFFLKYNSVSGRIQTNSVQSRKSHRIPVYFQ